MRAGNASNCDESTLFTGACLFDSNKGGAEEPRIWVEEVPYSSAQIDPDTRVITWELGREGVDAVELHIKARAAGDASGTLTVRDASDDRLLDELHTQDVPNEFTTQIYAAERVRVEYDPCARSPSAACRVAASSGSVAIEGITLAMPSPPTTVKGDGVVIAPVVLDDVMLTPSPYPPGLDIAWDLREPGALGMRVYFETFHLEPSYARVEVMAIEEDGSGTLVDVLTHELNPDGDGAVWTQEYDADHLRIRFVALDPPCDGTTPQGAQAPPSCGSKPYHGVAIGYASATVPADPRITWSVETALPGAMDVPAMIGSGFYGRYEFRRTGAQWTSLDLRDIDFGECAGTVRVKDGAGRVVFELPFDQAYGDLGTGYLPGDRAVLEIESAAIACDGSSVDRSSMVARLADRLATVCDTSPESVRFAGLWDGQGGTPVCRDAVVSHVLIHANAGRALSEVCTGVGQSLLGGSAPAVASVISDCQAALAADCLGFSDECGGLTVFRTEALVPRLPMGAVFEGVRDVHLQSLPPGFVHLDASNPVHLSAYEGLELRDIRDDLVLSVAPGLQLACGDDRTLAAAVDDWCARGRHVLLPRSVGGGADADLSIPEDTSTTSWGGTWRLPSGSAVILDGQLQSTGKQPLPQRCEGCMPDFCQELPSGRFAASDACSLETAKSLGGRDSDYDLLTDFAERCLLGTRWASFVDRDWDTDYDSLPDGVEVCGFQRIYKGAPDTDIQTWQVNMPAERVLGGPCVRDLLVRASTSAYGGQVPAVRFPENVQRPMLDGVEPLAFNVVDETYVQPSRGTVTDLSTGEERPAMYESARRGYWFYHRYPRARTNQDGRDYGCRCTYSQHVCDEPPSADRPINPDAPELTFLGHRPAADEICLGPDTTRPWERSELCESDRWLVEETIGEPSPLGCSLEPQPVRYGNAVLPNTGAVTTFNMLGPCDPAAEETGWNHLDPTEEPFPAPDPTNVPDREACFYGTDAEFQEIASATHRGVVPGASAEGADWEWMGLSVLAYSRIGLPFERAGLAGWAPHCGTMFRLTGGAEWGLVFVHEFGHNLNLHHAGRDVALCARNASAPDVSIPGFASIYNSVMHGAGWFRNNRTADPRARFSTGRRGVMHENDVVERGWADTGSSALRDRLIDWTWGTPLVDRTAEFELPDGGGTVRSAPQRNCEGIVCPAGYACAADLGDGAPVFTDLRRLPKPDPSSENPPAACSATVTERCCGDGVVDASEREICDEGGDTLLCRNCRGRAPDDELSYRFWRGDENAWCYRVTDDFDWNANGVIDAPGSVLWKQLNPEYPQMPDATGTGWNLDEACRFVTSRLNGEDPLAPGSPARGTWTIGVNATPVPWAFCKNPTGPDDPVLAVRAQLAATGQCVDANGNPLRDTAGNIRPVPDCIGGAPDGTMVQFEVPDPDQGFWFGTVETLTANVSPVHARLLVDPSLAYAHTDSDDFAAIVMPNLPWYRWISPRYVGDALGMLPTRDCTAGSIGRRCE